MAPPPGSKDDSSDTSSGSSAKQQLPFRRKLVPPSSKNILRHSFSLLQWTIHHGSFNDSSLFDTEALWRQERCALMGILALRLSKQCKQCFASAEDDREGLGRFAQLLSEIFVKGDQASKGVNEKVRLSRVKRGLMLYRFRTPPLFCYWTRR
jgi:hypothetical protein